MVQPERLRRICIFCGAPPEAKNREHPLPQWLLALTGDPSRVVTHGVDWKSQKPIRYAFDSFVFPACAGCNERWSGIENSAKAVVRALSRKESLLPVDYVLLLDWLDKVRIGLWLGHRYLQQTPITPQFTIDTRVGQKDRMVAVYPVGDHQRGLNVYGAETPLFQFKPSVFGIRINNILLLNASWDFMCSERCGYPYPRSVKLDVGTGLMHTADFSRKKRVAHPATAGLMKPCVLLHQPSLASVDRGSPSMATEHLDYHLSRAWPGRNGLGPLFRQFKDRTIELGSGEAPIEFDSIIGDECRMLKDLALQAYSLQNSSVCVFHAKSNTDSTASRSGVPREAEHRFHGKPIGHSREAEHRILMG